MAGSQKSCSVPSGMGTRLNEAAEENDMLESEVIRRALRFYENENPDEFTAFEDVRHGPAVANVARIDPASLVEDGAMETVDETVTETADETTDETGEVGAQEDAETDEDGTNSEDENAISDGVYDPTKEGV